MTKPIISIIGLGLTGTSIGLGLKSEEANFEIVGHDKDPAAANQAKRLGAVDRTSWNLFRSCEDAEMIVLATPLDELKEILELIGEDLKQGVLVLAICNVMKPALKLGKELLPPQIHFVTAHPIVTGIGGGFLSPRPDLFSDVPFCFSTDVDTDVDAVQLATDFVERLGASALFMDADEHDGLIAGVEQLPQFLAAVLLDTISGSAGWKEGRRLAGRQFAQSTELSGGSKRLSNDFLNNRVNLLGQLDQFQQQLGEWREFLASDMLLADEETSPEEEMHPLSVALDRTQKRREHWETQVILKDFDVEPQLETPSGRGFLQQMFFGNLLSGRASRSRETEQK